MVERVRAIREPDIDEVAREIHAADHALNWMTFDQLSPWYQDNLRNQARMKLGLPIVRIGPDPNQYKPRMNIAASGKGRESI